MANPQNFSVYTKLGVQVNYGLASQSQAGNYSIVNWNIQLVVTQSGGTGSSSTSGWNFQYPAGSVYNGQQGNAGSVTINSGSQPVIAGGQFTVYHNSDGTSGTVNIGAYVALYSGIGSGTAYASFGLPMINRYLTYTTASATNVTDESIQINIGTDSTFSNWGYSLDGGANYTWVGRSGTSDSVVLHNLLSNNTYSMYLIGTRSDSGLTNYSGNFTATTNAPNNVFDVGDF